MNKLLLGSIAAAAGTVLLLGGAGTFALWNDSASVASKTITSGIMEIDASTGSWDESPENWVPGDTFTYETDLTITAIGDNLDSTLTVTPGSLGTGALANALVVSMDVEAPSGLDVVQGNANKFLVTATESGSYTVPVEVTVTFPSSVGGTTAQDGTATLSGIAFTLAQQ